MKDLIKLIKETVSEKKKLLIPIIVAIMIFSFIPTLTNTSSSTGASSGSKSASGDKMTKEERKRN